MKKLFVIVLAMILLIGCGNRELSTEPDYDSIISYIVKNQKKESPELYQRCEQVLPEIIQRGEVEDYQKVITIYKKNNDIFSKAMTLGFLSSEKTDNPVLQDSIFSAVEQANQMVKTDVFLTSAKEYYAERNFSEEELSDRLTAYRAMISDGYAQLLIERSRLTDALNVYENIIGDYKDTEILLNYGKALNKMNRYEASLIACIEALKMTPGSLDAKAEIMNTAGLLGYSKAEINTMIDETIFVGRNILRQNLLADQLDIPMPEFRIEGIDSNFVTHEDFRDKILIVSFFATWCPPCRRELPHMNEVYHQFSDDEEVAIIVVSTDDDKFLVPPFISENGFDFPVYYAEGLNKEFGVKGIPTLFVIDKQGMIRYKKVGFSEGEEFEKIMSWYIEEIKAAENI
ncbi:MAG: redoxin domain-containing protein [Candidatus Marinimicrobia bacterium]|nr:redoxin domain-containing protein [Candidatus Neomarinimicrobiota bacterium]